MRETEVKKLARELDRKVEIFVEKMHVRLGPTLSDQYAALGLSWGEVENALESLLVELDLE